MKKKTKFRILYFLSYLCEGFDYCFLITFLNVLGYSATEKSIILATGACIGIVVQFISGYLCDKNRTVKRYVYLFGVLYGISTVLVYAAGNYRPIFHMIMVPINVGLFRLMMGLFDNWIIESDSDIARSFGSIRAFGSLGWAFGSYVGAYIIKLLGYFWMGISSVIALALSLIFALDIKDVDKVANDKLKYGDIVKILGNPMYVLIVASMFVVTIAQSSLDMTVVDKYSYLHATENEVSLYWSITGILELPLFFLGEKLTDRFHPLSLFMFATVIYGIRLFGYAGATSVEAMLWPSILQMLSYPVMNLINKDLVLAETPENLKSSGLQIGLALYSTMSALFSPLIAGMLEQRFDINVALYAIGSLSAVSLVMTCLYIALKKKSNVVS